MKKLTVLIVLVIMLFACGTVAYAASVSPSPTSVTSAAASRANDVLSAPSGSVVPQTAVAPRGAFDAQIAQYVIYAIAIAVVVILLVVFRRKYRKNKDE